MKKFKSLLICLLCVVIAFAICACEDDDGGRSKKSEKSSKEAEVVVDEPEVNENTVVIEEEDEIKPCSKCKGEGNTGVTCRNCDGDGWYAKPSGNSIVLYTQTLCEECLGHGGMEPCTKCEGMGYFDADGNPVEYNPSSESYSGGSVTPYVETPEPYVSEQADCPACNGGQINCRTCNGQRYVTKNGRSADYGSGSTSYTYKEKCSGCGGRGYTFCTRCLGDGKL